MYRQTEFSSRKKGLYFAHFSDIRRLGCAKPKLIGNLCQQYQDRLAGFVNQFGTFRLDSISPNSYKPLRSNQPLPQLNIRSTPENELANQSHEY